MAVKAKTKKKIGRPSLGHEDDFRRYAGDPIRGAYGWSIYPSREPLSVPVKKKHIEAAEPESPTECVIGIATSDFFDDKYIVEVGLTIIRVIDEKRKRLLLFKIPSALAKRMRLFDKMSFWDLPAGIYRMHPMPKKKKTKKTSARGGHGKTSKGGDFHGHWTAGQSGRAQSRKRPAAPTRVISRGRVLKQSPLLKKKKAG